MMDYPARSVSLKNGVITVFILLVSACHMMLMGAQGQVADERTQKIQIDGTTVVTGDSAEY